MLEAVPAVSPALAERRLPALQSAGLANWQARIGGMQVAELAAPLHVRPPVGRGRSGSRSACLPIDTPRAAAVRRLASRYGQP